MDFFGIGNAMASMVAMYMQVSRRTGRTSSLVESVMDGDRIIFDNAKEADRVRRLCDQRGVKVNCIVATSDQLTILGKSKGRTIFDHTWVERYYQDSIRRCGMELSNFEQHYSGAGTAPYTETERAYIERMKWNI